MQVSVSWINPSAEGRTILLSKSSVLANGMRTIGNEAGFVSLPTKAELAKFKVGDKVELPDEAKLVEKTFKGKNGQANRVVQAWTW